MNTWTVEDIRTSPPNLFALPSLGSVGGIGSSIVGFFTGGGWVLYAIIFAAGLGAGGYATHLYYSPKLANEKTATAQADARTADAKRQMADLATASQKAVADALKQVSDENIKAAQQSRKDATTIAQLQGRLAQEQIAHVQISAQLSAELQRAKANGNKLSDPVLHYLDELRRYDPGSAASNNSTPPSG